MHKGTKSEIYERSSYTITALMRSFQCHWSKKNSSNISSNISSKNSSKKFVKKFVKQSNTKNLYKYGQKKTPISVLRSSACLQADGELKNTFATNVEL